MALELIQDTEVSEATRINGRREQAVLIKYRFVGNLIRNAKGDVAYHQASPLWFSLFHR